MICQKHRIVNLESVNSRNDVIVHSALHALQVLSDDSQTEDFEEADFCRIQYWQVRNSLEDLGVFVEYIPTMKEESFASLI